MERVLAGVVRQEVDMEIYDRACDESQEIDALRNVRVVSNA